MLASGVWAGQFSEAFALAREDRDGISVGEALAQIGYIGEQTPGEHPVGAYFEAHIEQGPILEDEAKTIGIVQGVLVAGCSVYANQLVKQAGRAD